MAYARYYKTLFLPPLEGQHHLWKHDYAKLASKADEIVQLGNIIGCSPLAADKADRGPNAACLDYILLWRATYPKWTQIIGPHEVMALNFPDEWTNAQSNRILRRRWLLAEDFKGAFVVASANKGRLVSHGGLTYGEWISLDRPSTAEEAAAALQEKYLGTLYQGPSHRLTGRPNYAANPIFADPMLETYGSWLTAPEPPPFGQVHSAKGFNSIEGRGALQEEFSPLRFVEEVKFTAFGSLAFIGGQPFYAVAPDIPQDRFVRRLPEPWTPYIERLPVIDTRDEIFEGVG